jgi:hypothetical protein
MFHYQDGVVLGADTRATEGPIVADKNCEKIHFMAPNIYCCGAGTAADTEAVTGKVAKRQWHGILIRFPTLISFLNSFQVFASFIYFRYGQLPVTASPLCNWS